MTSNINIVMSEVFVDVRQPLNHCRKLTAYVMTAACSQQIILSVSYVLLHNWHLR